MEPKPQAVAFTVYTGNDNADGFVAVETEATEITEHVVLEKLIEYGALPADVALISLTEADGCLYLDFNAAFRDLIFAQGTAGEKMVIGSVVNTFLSAYGADCVQLTVEGEILESGHMVYDFPLKFMA